MLWGTGGNKEAKGDYNDAYRNVVKPSYIIKVLPNNWDIVCIKCCIIKYDRYIIK